MMSTTVPESSTSSSMPPTTVVAGAGPKKKEKARPRPLPQRMRSWVYNNIQRPWRIHGAPMRFVLKSPHPIDIGLMLLWPHPWKYSVPPPLPVQYLLDNPDTIYNRRDTEINYVTLRQIDRFCKRDTPLRSLYRLYETIVTDNDDEMMQESQYWFHTQPEWRIEDIPDPRDSDPLRYAILASLVDALVLSFNHKIKYGMRRGVTNSKPWKILEFRDDPSPPLESPPAWCAQVGPLSEMLVLEPGAGKVVPDGLAILPGPLVTDDDSPFIKRNIMAGFVQLYNV